MGEFMTVGNASRGVEAGHGVKNEGFNVTKRSDSCCEWQVSGILAAGTENLGRANVRGKCLAFQVGAGA